MNSDIDAAIHRLEGRGWNCMPNERTWDWPDFIHIRYPWVPPEVRKVLGSYSEVVSPNQTFWLLTVRDFAGQSSSAFAWNEWELLSLKAAVGDPKWAHDVRRFWDEHFPVALSVGDGYVYFALRRDGSVVIGREPEFQNANPIANSYLEFIVALERGNGANLSV